MSTDVTSAAARLGAQCCSYRLSETLALLANPLAFCRVLVPAWMDEALRRGEGDGAWFDEQARRELVGDDGQAPSLAGLARQFELFAQPFDGVLPPVVDGDASPLLSPLLRAFELDANNVLVVHPFIGTFACLSTRAWRMLCALDAARFDESAANAVGRRAAARFLNYLRRKQFLAVGEDAERERIHAATQARVAGDLQVLPATRALVLGRVHPWHRHAVPAVDITSFRTPTPLYDYDLKASAETLKIALIGNCAIQLLKNNLELAAQRIGHLDVQVSHQFDAGAVAGRGADLIVVGVNVHDKVFGGRCDRLFDRAHLLERLAVARAECLSVLATLAAAAPHSLVVFIGATTPQVSPVGRAAFRIEHDMRALFEEEVNGPVRRFAAGNPNLMFLDSDRLFSQHGKARHRDDLVAPLRHAGMLDAGLHAHPAAASIAASTRAVFGAAPVTGVHLLATEIMDCWTLWRGVSPVKVIVVDLDNTLWRGVAGERAATPDDDLAGDYGWGALGGLHEALNIVRQRGVALVTCSKNEEHVSLGFWRRMAERLAPWTSFLTPDDFVLHKISWRRKSDVIREVCAQLNLRTASVLVIDDNPLERAEIAAALPDVRLLGEDLNLARHVLLDDPHLQSNLFSEESRDRERRYREKLTRDVGAEGMSEREFLQGLGIAIEIRHETTLDNADRISELIQRTTQFNTNQDVATPAYARSRLADARARVYTARVRDKFSEHGLVACCVVTDRIEIVCVSCRVLSLKVAVPLLSRILASLPAAAFPLAAALREDDENRACHDLFEQCGFRRVDGVWTLAGAGDLPAVDGQVHAIGWWAGEAAQAAS